MSFVGDIGLNDDYIDLYKKGEKPFADVENVLKDSDYVIGNLECIAEGDQGENELKKPRLKTTLDTLNYLDDINLNLATLAQNHIYDNMEDGYEKTVNFLAEHSIDHMGAGTSEEIAQKPLLKTINDISFCFLNYVSKDTNPKLPEDSNLHLNWFDVEKIKADIVQYRSKADFIILLFHWGGNYEGGYYPGYEQPSIAKELIDAGADMIVGHHSHTLQPYEVYKGKYIFYSLGNFCFSDAPRFNYEIDQKKATHSIILHVNFQKDHYDIEMTPIRNVNSFIMTDQSVMEDFKTRIKRFNFFKDSKFLWSFYHYNHKYIYPISYYFWGNDRTIIQQLKKIKLEKILYYFSR